MFQYITLTILFTCVYSLLLPDIENEIIESSKKCLGSIGDKYFVQRPDVSIFTTNILRDNDVLYNVLQSVRHVKKFFNFTTFKTNFLDVRKKYSIITAQNIQDLMINKQLDYLALWNARSKYIIYIFENTNIEKFSKFLWNYYILNAIIIMPSNYGDVLNIYSWFPYKNGKCGEDIFPELIETCQNGILTKKINLFPNKIPKNLNGCPVRIRVLNWAPFVLPPKDGPIKDNIYLNITQGIEVKMTLAIARVANFTIKFSSSTVPHDWGLATFDGNVTGTIKVLREKQADIGMGSFGPTTERRMYCDFSVCHLQEKLTWCVPKAGEGPRWKNLLQPFKIMTWLAMILIYIIISIIVWILSIIPPKDPSSYINIHSSFMQIFCTFLGQSAQSTPKKISNRISFFIWLFFGLHFIVAYQAKLIGLLLKPNYEHQISSIEEVLKSGMEYQILPTHKRFYSNTDDWKVAKIIREFTSCEDSDECLKRVAYKRDFALCTLKAHAEFEALKYRNSEGEPLVYCIDYVTYASELYMTKGFPLKERIDKLIYKIRDSGLMFKWQNDLQYIWSYKYRNTLPKDNGEDKKLTMDHMQGAFGVLILGLLTAFLTLILEIISRKIQRNSLKIKI